MKSYVNLWNNLAIGRPGLKERVAWIYNSRASAP